MVTACNCNCFTDLQVNKKVVDLQYAFEAFNKLKIQELIINRDYFEKNVVKKYAKQN